MKHKVLITGMGVVSPVGNDIETMFGNIRSGRNGIASPTLFSTEITGIHVAGEVKEFETEPYINKREARRMDRFTQLAMVAACQAWEDSGLDGSEFDRERVGIVLGSGMGGLTTISENTLLLDHDGPQSVSPLFIPKTIINVAAGMIAIKLDLHGACYGVVTACSSGNDAIGQGYYAVREGRLDAMLVGGSEAVLNELAVQGFHQMQAITESTDPDRASMPFDKDRSGFVMGEGSAFLLLEREESALARGAKIYGEIAGFAQTCDAFHMTAPNEDGTYSSKAMKMAIEDAGIAKEEIGYINAHGTSTPLNDVIETKAIRICFGNHADKLLVSSTKSMTGHLLGAAGALEAVITTMALREGVAPPTIGLETESEGCDLDYVKKTAKPMDCRYAMSNSLGFGGHNSVVVIGKYGK